MSWIAMSWVGMSWIAWNKSFIRIRTRVAAKMNLKKNYSWTYLNIYYNLRLNLFRFPLLHVVRVIILPSPHSGPNWCKMCNAR